jgi:hypothetical protein
MSRERIESIVRRMRAHIGDVATAMMSPNYSARDAHLVSLSAPLIRKWADELEALATEGEQSPDVQSPAEKMRAHLAEFGK